MTIGRNGNCALGNHLIKYLDVLQSFYLSKSLNKRKGIPIAKQSNYVWIT